MKTQMVKNSIIVPVGSQGRLRAEGRRAARGPPSTPTSIDRYREFVSGLLDVTDNIVDGKVLHPPEVVRHDGDDPYLVVAADKGTAHLSRHRQQRLRPVRLLAGRRVRLRRQRRLRPQEGRHHRARGLGVREAPLPQPRPRRADAALHRAPASATWRATSSATGCCRARPRSWWPPSTTLHIFIDPDPDPAKTFARARAPVPPAALELARLRRRADQQGRRHLRPLGQGHPAVPRDAQAARPRGGERQRARR